MSRRTQTKYILGALHLNIEHMNLDELTRVIGHLELLKHDAITQIDKILQMPVAKRPQGKS